MRNIDIQGIFDSTIRHIEFEVQDESFQNDVDREMEVVERDTVFETT